MTVARLEIARAEASRGTFHLGPVDLTVASGERVAVIGPNGAGKSTLLSIACGDLAPEAGSVRVSGADPRSLRRVERARRVAVLRQGGEVVFSIPVLEAVLHGRWAHLDGLRFPSAADVERAREELARVGLAGFEGRALGTLSGGERQRVQLARALVQESPLLLLDEPTSSQDLRHRVEVHHLLAAAAGAGRALVVVTHDLDLAAALCERALLLRDGAVLAAGPVTEVLAADPLRDAFGHPVHVHHADDGSIRVTPTFGEAPADVTGRV